MYAVPKGTLLVRGDLKNRGLLKSAIAEHHIDGVMHFAGSSEAAESMKMPEKYFRNNTANTLSLSRNHAGMRSDAPSVFFYRCALRCPEQIPIEEDDALKPTNAYGESKLLVERMLTLVSSDSRPTLRQSALF